jgi:hypothetical protein
MLTKITQKKRINKDKTRDWGKRKCLSPLRTAITSYHTLNCLQTADIYFPQFWKLGSPGQGAVRVGVWRRPAFCYRQMAAFSLCPYVVERMTGLSGGLFLKALIPFMRGLSSWPNCLPKDPPLNNITSRVGWQHFIGGRGVSIAENEEISKTRRRFWEKTNAEVRRVQP